MDIQNRTELWICAVKVEVAGAVQLDAGLPDVRHTELAAALNMQIAICCCVNAVEAGRHLHAAVLFQYDGQLRKLCVDAAAQAVHNHGLQGCLTGEMEGAGVGIEPGALQAGQIVLVLPVHLISVQPERIAFHRSRGDPGLNADGEGVVVGRLHDGVPVCPVRDAAVAGRDDHLVVGQDQVVLRVHGEHLAVVLLID